MKINIYPDLSENKALLAICDQGQPYDMVNLHSRPFPKENAEASKISTLVKRKPK